ncbi:uncharacterized protein HaLaN_24527, partial [Haematococcus lacustris]
LEGGSLLEYDWLVLSMGSEVRGALDAIEVKAAAAAASYPPPASSIVIVGAGYAGVELAAVIAERLRRSGANRSVRVQLVTPGAGILEGSPLGQRQAAEQVLAGLDVEVVTGARVKSMEPSPELAPLLTSALVNLEPGPSTASHTQIDSENPLDPGVSPVSPRAISADLVIWTAGSSPATKSARQGFPFPADARGSVQTVDGQQLAQTAAIERYVAKLTGMYPDDPWQAAKGEELICFCVECFELFNSAQAIKDPEQQAAARGAIVDGPLQAKLAKLNEVLGALGPDTYVAGSKDVTCMDISLFSMLSFLSSGFFLGIPRDLLGPFPGLVAYHDRIARLPGIQAVYEGVTEGPRLAFKVGGVGAA